jgi:hypothetical protein
MDLPCPENHIVPEKNREAGPDSGKNGTALPEAGNFTVDYRRTVFYGLCGECRNKKGESTTPP